MKFIFDITPEESIDQLQITRDEYVGLSQAGSEFFPTGMNIEITDFEGPIEPEDVASLVIPIMQNMPELEGLPVSELDDVPLGKLRRDTTRKLGCCRYLPGTMAGLPKAPGDVRRIDLHPQLLTPRWFRLAASVLYHEYLHALGLSHGHRFRYLESLWPDEEARFGTRKRWPTGSLAGSFSLEF